MGKRKRPNNHAGYCRWLRDHGFDSRAAEIEANPPDDSLPHSRAALLVYYRDDEPRVTKMFHAMFTPASLADIRTFDARWEAYLAAEQAALVKLQDAFHRDTHWLNSRDNCALVGPGDVRRFVEAANPGIELPPPTGKRTKCPN